MRHGDKIKMHSVNLSFDRQSVELRTVCRYLRRHGSCSWSADLREKDDTRRRDRILLDFLSSLHDQFFMLDVLSNGCSLILYNEIRLFSILRYYESLATKILNKSKDRGITCRLLGNTICRSTDKILSVQRSGRGAI